MWFCLFLGVMIPLLQMELKKTLDLRNHTPECPVQVMKYTRCFVIHFVFLMAQLLVSTAHKIRRLVIYQELTHLKNVSE